MCSLCPFVSSNPCSSVVETASTPHPIPSPPTPLPSDGRGWRRVLPGRGGEGDGSAVQPGLSASNEGRPGAAKHRAFGFNQPCFQQASADAAHSETSRRYGGEQHRKSDPVTAHLGGMEWSVFRGATGDRVWGWLHRNGWKVASKGLPFGGIRDAQRGVHRARWWSV